MAKPPYSAIDFKKDGIALCQDISKAINESLPLKSKIKDFADSNYNIWKEGQNKKELKVLGQQNPKKSKVIINRIFADMESSIPVITANTPSPDVKNVPNDERETISNWLEQRYETTYKMAALIQQMTRSWYINRIGILKYRWDKDEENHFITEFVHPAKVGFDKNAKTMDECDYIWQELDIRVDLLAKKFPDCKKELETQFPDLKGRTKYYEVWFGNGKYVAWAIPQINLVLDKMKNPNWDYGEEALLGEGDKVLQPAREPSLNIFDKPEFPFLILNLLHGNEDNGMYDDTSLIEQCASIQEQCNKIERQIADLNEGKKRTWVISGRVMSEDKAQDIVNQTGDVLMYLDRDVPDGGVNLPISGDVDSGLYTHLLHLYQEVDNIMGVHAILRGDQGMKETLGGKKMDLTQDISRMDILVRRIEYVMEEWYVALLHMEKVYEDVPQNFEVDGEQQTIDFRTIPEDIEVSVKKGSTLPLDDKTRMDMAIQLSKEGLMSPKDVFQELGYGRSDEIYRNLIEWMVMTGKLPPQSLQMVGDQSPAAQMIQGEQGGAQGGGQPGQPGQPPQGQPGQPPQGGGQGGNNPQPSPLQTLQAQVQKIELIVKSPAFATLPPEQKAQLTQQLQQDLQKIKQLMAMTQSPSQGQPSAGQPQLTAQ